LGFINLRVVITERFIKKFLLQKNMAQHNDLEAITVMTFHDADREFARRYQGLLNFQEGDIINLIRTSQEMPVSPGNYVIRRGNILMDLALDNEAKPDSVYRYYDCKKLP
jgi:hypothetical protein